MEDVVTAKADYSKLDEAGGAVRIRLNSTVVHGNIRRRERSANCLTCAAESSRPLWRKIACWPCYNGMIPYLCPELPEKQRKRCRIW